MSIERVFIGNACFDKKSNSQLVNSEVSSDAGGTVNTPRFPIFMSLLASILSNRKMNVRVYDSFAQNEPETVFFYKINSFNPDVILIERSIDSIKPEAEFLNRLIQARSNSPRIVFYAPVDQKHEERLEDIASECRIITSASAIGILRQAGFQINDADCRNTSPGWHFFQMDSYVIKNTDLLQPCFPVFLKDLCDEHVTPNSDRLNPGYTVLKSPDAIITEITQLASIYQVRSVCFMNMIPAGAGEWLNQFALSYSQVDGRLPIKASISSECLKESPVETILKANIKELDLISARQQNNSTEMVLNLTKDPLMQQLIASGINIRVSGLEPSTRNQTMVGQRISKWTKPDFRREVRRFALKIGTEYALKRIGRKCMDKVLFRRNPDADVDENGAKS